ncbi:MAG: Gldg family protein, partial [Pseudomonadota bacterium]
MTETTLSKRTQAVVAIVLAIVLFLAVNIFTNNTFRSARADLTETGLYSLSQGTRDLLANLEEPLHLRLFLSKSLVQSAPQLSAYANRVQSLLATYRNLANGRITLEVIDPEPFSDAEDRAVA